ncbi:hypothetical protein BU25DRAFT_342630 [Macroventuria anomochaeta]|uniref:Uncharacterized protein n=1 Tax=Macroventuria anomochaeta TaxID=301207 RepID=A0ACB6RYE4_9PLEO|nr:uncharacterized protein BU25DRAFT_342630 [Macroventuria anomochaeta]KAF2626794.1 hypothetical protein BU25DRAFT_342630 [Macroventuria anomochaeta]
MAQPAIAARYAVLIGIDAYPESPLRGCVTDVTEMKKHLVRKFPAVHMRAFTASPSEVSTPSGLVENPEFWPTYHNVVSSLHWVTSAAKPGDLVYIHFSGHGINVHPRSDPHVSDLALVLLEVRDSVAIRYLRGFELAWLLKNMVEKDLMVTLVLDCCESGSVMRSDSAVRSIKYNPKVDATYPLQADRMLHHNTESDSSTHRAASMRPNWLLNPNGYTILTACGPTEQAKEIELKHNGKRHGALSYFLINAFAKPEGVEVKSRHMYYHLCARFRETRDVRQNEQNPMFYGNRDLGFFGDTASVTDRMAVPVLRTADRGLQLEAGQAHGICSGDRFALHPLGQVTVFENTHTASTIATIATVIKVEALRSYLKLLDAPTPFPSTGWMATPLTYFSLRNFPIKLDVDLPLPLEWVDAFQEKESLLLYNAHVGEPDATWSFRVTPTIEHSYEICDDTTADVIHVPNAHGDNWIPDKTKESGRMYYEDTIKVFLTNQPTSFMSLELPGLATQAERGERAQTRRWQDTRLSDDWAAFNFRVRIFVK